MFVRDFALALFDESLFRNRDVVLFEDADTERDLFPLAVLRPSWDIRYGTGCLGENVEALVGTSGVIVYRPRLHMHAMSARISGTNVSPATVRRDTVFLNGRLLAAKAEKSEKIEEWLETIVDSEGRPLIAFRTAAQAKNLLSVTGTDLATLLVQDSKGGPFAGVTSARFVWDYMKFTLPALERQFSGLPKSLGAHALREGASGIQIIGDHPVVCGDGVVLLPSTVFDTRQGAIYIGDKTEVEPFCYLQGPLFVGKECRIKSGTKLYQGSSFGNQCRVGGEIGSLVLQGFVNKQHDGFLGNSHLGSWVNLGADTTVSNLRNDYATVKMKVGGKLVDSDSMNIGFIAGDHTKTGINTMLNTGTIAGVGCNIFGADYPPRYIKSFSWGGATKLKAEPLARMLATAETVMSRRGQELSAEERELLTRHYHETVKEES